VVLKDKINENFDKLTKDKDKNMSEEKMNVDFKGELEIWAIKDGKVIHHDIEKNIVTKWAKHATMHLLTSESYSTHGDRTLGTETAYSKRMITDHTAVTNIDGTMMSDAQYLSDNTDYYEDSGSGLSYQYQTVAHPDLVADTTDSSANFVYPFFPTKMLFGTGIEFASWADVTADERGGIGQDGYGNQSNGAWDETSFDNLLTVTPTDKNYYSALWNGTGYVLTKTRTVNDVYSAALTTTLDDDSFGVKGAIKNGTYTGQNPAVLTTIDENDFSNGSYRGIGRPAFIYAKKNQRFFQSEGETVLELGETTGTTDLESKLTYTVIMPEQTTGQFYPYNGYTLKVAGLFADAPMLLKNTIPASNTNNDDVLTSGQEYTNYQKMPTGILWATRNIAPIYKSHDTKIIAQWTIYL